MSISPGGQPASPGSAKVSADLRNSSKSIPTADQNHRLLSLKISFKVANAKPSVEPFDCLETHVSYYLGNDPAKWHVDVPVWGGVRYKDLYPGIDRELTGEGGHYRPDG